MLCKLLVERGDQAVVIDNLSNGRREFLEELGPKAQLVQADIRDTDTVREIIADVRPESVCHLAAVHFIPYCNDYPQETLDVNVLGTLSVLEACEATPPEMIVIASSAAVYDICDQPCRETDAVNPLDIYGISKYADEHLARRYVGQTGAGCTAVRISNAVGPNETNPHLLPHLVDQLNEGAACVALGNLESCRDYIDTQDLARGLIALMDRREEGYDVFNIGAGKEYSVKEIVEMCERILGRSIEIEQRADLVRKVDRMHLCVCNDKIRNATGWRPRVSLDQTLQDLLVSDRSSASNASASAL